MPSQTNRLFTIGIDYGTESGRAVLVDIANGRIEALHVTRYRHGVIDDKMKVTRVKRVTHVNE